MNMDWTRGFMTGLMLPAAAVLGMYLFGQVHIYSIGRLVCFF